MKKLLIIIPLLLLTSVYFLWQPTITYLLDSSLKGYIQNNLKGDVAHGGILKQGGKWIIDKPMIYTPKREFLAKWISIGVEVHPFSRAIDIDLIVTDPKITIEKEASELKAFLAECIPHTVSAWIVNINSRIQIDSGSLHWGDAESALFQLHAKSNGHKKSGSLVFDLNKGKVNSNIFEMTLDGNEEGNNIDLVFKEVDCASFSHAIESFGIPLDGWKVSRGWLNGKITLETVGGKRPRLIGEATLKHLSFSQKELNLRGEIKGAHLDARTDTLRSGERGVIGKFELTDDSAIHFLRGGSPYWEMKKLVGGVYFQGKEIAVIDLKGECSHLGSVFGLDIEGDLRFLEQYQSSIDIAAKLISPSEEVASMRFVARQLGADCNCAEVEIKNVGKDEFTFVQTALGRYASEWESFRMLGGSVNASGIVYMKGYRITDIKIDEITASKLKYEVDPWEMAFGVKETKGNLSISLDDEDPLNTLMASFSVEGGKMKFQGINGKSWKFSNVSTNLNVKNGVIEKSLLKGELEGLKGSVGFDWNTPEQMMHVNFNGTAEALTALMPEFLEKGVKKEFGGDHVTLSAGMSRQGDKKCLEGVLTLVGGQSDDVDSISFGFDLDKSLDDSNRNSPVDHVQLLKELIPNLSAGVASPAIAGYSICNGWFKARNLPFGKYVSPFIFPSGEIKLTGRGNFKGYVDSNQLAVEYDGVDAALENKHLMITLNNLSKVNNQYPVHYVNFAQGTHFGSIPIQDAEYYDKHTGLKFTVINTGITLEGEEIHLANVKGECCGIEMGGSIDIDFGIPDDQIFEVDFQVDKLSGSIADAKQLLNEYDPNLSLLKIPLEGDLFLREKGGHLYFSFTPEDYSVRAEIEGGLKHGVLRLENEGEVLTDLALNFSYEHEKKRLEFTHIHAKLPFERDLVLTGDRILFSDLSKSEGKFDLWVGEGSQDWMRIVGRISEFDPERMVVDFNDVNTHFGKVDPSDFKLVIRNWDELERLDLSAQLNLEELYDDSQKLFQLIDFPFANDLPSLSGDLNLDLSYNLLRGDTRLSILGNDLTLGDFNVGSLSVKGVKKGEQWSVEEMSSGKLRLSGDVLSDKKHVFVDKMNLQLGQSVSMKISGEVLPKARSFEGSVEDLQLDLSSLGEWDSEQDIVKQWTPQGLFKGSGKVSFEPREDGSGFRVDAILNTLVEDCELKGLSYANTEGFSCHFISDKGITFRNIKSFLKKGSERVVEVNLDRAEYSFVDEEFILDDLSFAVDAKDLSWAANTLQRKFPLVITSKVVGIIQDLRSEGIVKGVYQLGVTPDQSSYSIRLDDGEYTFLGVEHGVKDFQLRYESSLFEIKTRYRIGDSYFWLDYQTLSPTFEHGQLYLSEKKLLSDALKVEWTNYPQEGFSIHYAQGEFAGLSFNLKRDPTWDTSMETIGLVGRVKMDATKASSLLSKELQEHCINWGIGDGYELAGEWQIQKGNSDAGRVYFSGKLAGESCAFKGYRWDHLTAQVVSTPEVIHFHNLTVVDEGGDFHAEQLEFLKGEDDSWLISLPKLEVTYLRPSLLRITGEPRPTMGTPFVIRELALRDLYGSFSNTKTFSGEGELHFTNSSKKARPNNIFDVPADFLARIGLDLTAFNPVTGTVYYEIDDGQILLTKSKDMYSERKFSKFYFPANRRSTIDFDGRVNVQLRMKQHGLLFKLAEPFAVNIRGTLQEPTYKISTESKRKRSVPK